MKISFTLANFSNFVFLFFQEDFFLTRETVVDQFNANLCHAYTIRYKVPAEKWIDNT